MFVFQIRHINCISKLSPRRKALKQLTNLPTLEAAYNLEDAKQEQDTCDKANKEIYTAGTHFLYHLIYINWKNMEQNQSNWRQGKLCRVPSYIKCGNNLALSPDQIAVHFSDHFARATLSLKHKYVIELYGIDFSSNKPYNQTFTMNELTTTISKMRGSASGVFWFPHHLDEAFFQSSWTFLIKYGFLVVYQIIWKVQ